MDSFIQLAPAAIWLSAFYWHIDNLPEFWFVEFDARSQYLANNVHLRHNNSSYNNRDYTAFHYTMMTFSLPLQLAGYMY